MRVVADLHALARLESPRRVGAGDGAGLDGVGEAGDGVDQRPAGAARHGTAVAVRIGADREHLLARPVVAVEDRVALVRAVDAEDIAHRAVLIGGDRRPPLVPPPSLRVTLVTWPWSS
jgi:hypothetical protein